MAGSITAFIYRANPTAALGGGVPKLVNLDESNQRQIGALPATPATATAAGVSKISKLDGSERYILLKGKTAAGLVVTRKIIIGNELNSFFLSGGNVTLPILTDGTNSTVENVSFQVTLAVGERRSFPTLTADTGLDDGTNP